MQLRAPSCAILTALLFVTATNAIPAESLLLDRIPVVYYQFTGVGLAWLQSGQLDSFRGLFLDHGETIATPPDFPDAAFDKPLIAVDDWAAYARLSSIAVSNFELLVPETPMVIDGRAHAEVRVRPEANVATGPLLNISTRAWVASGGTAAIAGFVVGDRPRAVLIRGVGPTLTGLGVADAISDPFITLFRGSTPFYESTDWGLLDKQQKIAAAELANAFPLDDNSKDAAMLIDLDAGAYTVHMGVESGEPGIGLVEVYILPDNSLLATVPAGE